MPIPILYLIDLLYQFSGTERHLYDLVENLDRSRFKPFVLAFQGSEEFAGYLEGFGVPVRLLDISRAYGLRQFQLLFSLRQFINKEQIKIIQTFHTNADLYGTVLAKFSGIPVVISSRRDMGIDRTAKSTLCYRLLNRYVDHVICVSEKVRQYMMREDRIEKSKTSVIYNGVKPAELEKAVDILTEKNRLGIGLHQPVVGMLANFNPIKGHEFFLDACPAIKKAVPDTQFVFAGYGPAEDAMRQKAARLGLGPCMHFLGHRRDNWAVLSMMDILVSPSLSEGFSNTLLEALYMMKPVVATRVGGNPEVIFPGETGILIPPGDPEAIARATIQLLNDRAFARHLGENGRILIEKRFLIKHMMDNTANLYQNLLKKKRIIL